jgi:TfoX/Sxy family transcriptional regulator of competence genes
VAIDEVMRLRVREHLKGMRKVEEKSMFGGICFMWRGNLLCGVSRDTFLVRVAKDDFDEYIKDKGANPMVMAGRSSKGWIRVDKAVLDRDAALQKWIDRAKEFVSTLPAK